ncbi:MAG TPA: sulfite exporter TauE/SafE family protein [Rhodothermales bacterium]|nr:sulfite exporter TauE/SafE family protein [Rhodothermales bacterium]
MPDFAPLLILFGVGLAAGTINVMAGGGSTLTLPTLIFLGLDTATANGTNRIAIVLQNVFATWSFRREKMSRFRETLTFALWTIPGAIAGAVAAVQIGDEWFRRILGIVMIGVVISMLVPRNKRQDLSDEGSHSWWIYPSLFGIGFYGGFIQVGVGFLIMAAFYHLLKLNLVFVNMHKVLVVLVYTIPALLIFTLTGHVDWMLGLSLAAGNSMGGWWAARLSVRRGEKAIRYVLIVAVLIMAGKILGVF